MTDYDYGYWIMRQSGAPVAAIRGAVLTEAKSGRFTAFGRGVFHEVLEKGSVSKVESAFLTAYHRARKQHQIPGCV